jgi:hypothetical protein
MAPVCTALALGGLTQLRPRADVLDVMRTYRATALLLLLILATAATSVIAEARSPAIPCRPSGRKVLAADVQAVVYLGRVAAHPSYTSYKAFLGCLRGARRAFEVGGPGVGSSSGFGVTRRLMLVGAFAAWEQSEGTNPPGEPAHIEWHVNVRNLRTGQMVHALPTGTADPRMRNLVGNGPTTQIVVKADGAVAWVVQTVGESGQPATYEVHAADRDGARLVASGPDIAPHSLASAKDTLYWTQGGKPASAKLN